MFNQKMVLKCVNVSSKCGNRTAFRQFCVNVSSKITQKKLTISWAGTAWHSAAPDLGRGTARHGTPRAESGAHLAFEGTLAFENMSGATGYVRISVCVCVRLPPVRACSNFAGHRRTENQTSARVVCF